MRYTNETLRFGQIDIGKFPELAEVFKIDVSGMSKPIASFILFENGKEKQRLPPLNKKNEVIKTIITKESVIRVFELDTRYLKKRDQELERTHERERERERGRGGGGALRPRHFVINIMMRKMESKMYFTGIIFLQT